MDLHDVFTQETLQAVMNAAATIKGDTVNTLDEAIKILEADPTGTTSTPDPEALNGMQDMAEYMAAYFLDGADLSQITPDTARGVLAQMNAQAQPGTPQATMSKEFSDKAFRTLHCEIMDEIRTRSK